MAEKAPNNTDNSNSDSEFGNDENPNPNSSSNNALAVNGFPSSSLVCLVKFAGDTATGAVMGAIFGYGSLSSFFEFFVKFYFICS